MGGLHTSISVKRTDTQDGVVLLDVQQGLCFPLDQVGTLIWKRIELGYQIGEIAQYISETYQIPLEQASYDVHEFVQQLQSKHLVHEQQGVDKKMVPQRFARIGLLWRRFTRRHSNHAT
jgi:hypothetical protein